MWPESVLSYGGSRCLDAQLVSVGCSRSVWDGWRAQVLSNPQPLKQSTVLFGHKAAAPGVCSLKVKPLNPEP